MWLCFALGLSAFVFYNHQALRFYAFRCLILPAQTLVFVLLRPPLCVAALREEETRFAPPPSPPPLPDSTVLACGWSDAENEDIQSIVLDLGMDLTKVRCLFALVGNDFFIDCWLTFWFEVSTK